MSESLRKLCLAGPLRAGKSALWRELTGQEPKSCGFSQAPLKHHPQFSLWDSQGGCALDSLGQAFLSGAEAVLVTVAADMRSSGVEATRMVAAVRALRPQVRVGIALTRADLGVGADVDALFALAPVFPVAHAHGPGMGELLRFLVNTTAVPTR
ncbi:MAG: hypothetical protein R3F10_10595 [Lysobacteraceae bacterium]